MKALAFPSRKRPQFYISDNQSAIGFFINNLFFSKRKNIQSIINITKHVLPVKMIALLLKTFVQRDKKLPPEMTETVNEILKLIRRTDRGGLLCGIGYNSDVGFIIRNPTWQREIDKYVVIIFVDTVPHPSLIAKVISTGHIHGSSEREFHMTSDAYQRYGQIISIPKPIALYTLKDKKIYLETAIKGIPVNNYLKSIFTKRRRERVYIHILKRCEDILCEFSKYKKEMEQITANRYFREPIDNIERTPLGSEYPFFIQRVKGDLSTIGIDCIPSVFMHGDMWGGSVLYNNGDIGLIDWEFSTYDGVPLWDLFSLVFHTGAGIAENRIDFMNYFTSPYISNEVDNIILRLADACGIEKRYIPFLFRCFLMFNIYHKDRPTEQYWQECLHLYLQLLQKGEDRRGLLLS